MTRYFLHLEGPAWSERDLIGAEVPDLRALLALAYERAAELVGDRRLDPACAHYRILDDSGRFELVLALDALLSSAHLLQAA